MTKKDPLDPRNATTPATEISADELEARMQRKEEIEKPGVEAVKLIENGMSKVLMTLGVDTNQDDDLIKIQQEVLGITITDAYDSGFFVFTGEAGYIPYAYIGDAGIDSTGCVFVKIHWFMDDREEVLTGTKVRGK
jgi:hypothetical protein